MYGETDRHDTGRKHMLKKNDIIEIEITDTGSEGEGIGRADGMAFFVVGAIPGDTVRAGVMKLKKTYGYARLIEILKPSPNRVKPRCRVAALCGGCQLQHESYEAQLKFKTDKVLNCLTRIGGLVREESHYILRDPENGEEAVMFETVGAAEIFGYRNKSQYPVGKDKTGKTVAGFYRNHSHDIIPCTECALAHPVAGSIMDAVLAYMDKAGVTAYSENHAGEGSGHKRTVGETERGVVRHVLIRTGHATKQVMVCKMSFRYSYIPFPGAL